MGAARSGNPDVVRIVARRFYRGASADAVRPRSRRERAPAPATPSDPTPRSRHARATACAHLGAVVIDICDTRQADAKMPSAGAERVGAAQRAGRRRRDGAAPVLPRSRPTARPARRRRAGKGERHMPSGRPGRPTQVTTGEPSERPSRHLDASAWPRLEDATSSTSQSPWMRQAHDPRLPKPTTEGVPHRPPLCARRGGRRRTNWNARGWRRGARVLRRYACPGSTKVGAPFAAHALLCSLREKCRTRLRTGGEREDDC